LDRGKKTQHDDKSMECAQQLLQIAPIVLPIEGVLFLVNVINSKTELRESHRTSGATCSVIIPVYDNNKGEHEYFRAMRDSKKEYSADGDAILIIDTCDKSYVYGVIYADQPIFYSHRLVRAKKLLEPTRQLLYDNIFRIMTEIATDAEAYFSTIGKKCGMCLFCGRELTDETSKQNGYGPVCGRVFHWRP
jgi:hypothetical protein